MLFTSKFINLFKGMGCGVLVWFLMYGGFRLIQSVRILRMFQGPLRLLILVAGPAIYPWVIWFVFQHQLPPLTPRYIKKNWPLWIPGFLVACLPSLDILLLGKFLFRQILGG